jgi:hypothetical protein
MLNAPWYIDYILWVMGAMVLRYWPTRHYLLKFAQQQAKNPRELYFHACLLFLATCIVMTMLFVGLGLVAGLVGLLSAFIFLQTIGVIGWLLLGMRYLLDVRDRLAYRKEHPQPRLQYWLQDILLTVVLWGTAMTILCPLYPQYVWWIACGLLIMVVLGLGACLDILRRMPVPPTPAIRAAMLAAVIFWFTISAMVGGLVTWSAWRSALIIAEIEKWKRREAIRPYSPSWWK